MIDFTLSEKQNAIREMAETFAANVLSTASSTYQNYPTQRERFQSLRPFYRKAVEAGLIKNQIPQHLGGSGGTMVETAILVEQISKADRNLSVTIFGTGLGLLPLIFGGTPEQHEEFLEPFLSGDGEPLASLLHSEPAGTADWLEMGGRGLQTTARRAESGDWIINGEKMWTINSSGWDDRGADLQCVVCRYSEDESKQDRSVSPADLVMILLVTREVIEANEPGAYQVLGHLETAGHSSTARPHTKFTEFRVPSRHLLGPAGMGAEIVIQSFTATAALVGAMSVGIMAASFEAALEFAKVDSRRTGKKPLLSRQSVSDLLTDVKMRTDAARFLTWKACHALDTGLGGELALEAKIYCSDSAVRAVTNIMSTMGMSSHKKKGIFPRLLNDALSLPLFDGGTIGGRRGGLEMLIAADDYEPWAATYPSLWGDSETYLYV